MKKSFVFVRPDPTTSRPAERKVADDAGMTKVTLTPEQIENWRQVLLLLLGPFALIMPAEMVQEWKDKFQAAADKFEEEMKNNEKTK